jgi:PAS domain S-box-containing protein
VGFWRFADQQSVDGLLPLVPSYDYTLGWVAGLLAVFAGFALFPTLARVRSAPSATSRRAWHFGGALTMSIGFWGGQNVALLGFELPTWYYYEPSIGFAALLPAMAGCAATIRVLAEPSRSFARLNLGALSLSAGIAAMHFALMEAIRGDVILTYTLPGFVQSLILGYGFALVALYVNRALDAPGAQGWARWLAGSLVLGVTVIGNHFAAMSAVSFFDDPALVATDVSVVPAYLLPLIAGCVLFIVTAYWMGSLVDGRLAEAGAAVRRNEAQHRAVIETMLDAHLVMDRNNRVTSFNPAAEAVFGWSAAEIVGEPVSRLFNSSHLAGEREWPAPPAESLALGRARRRWVRPGGGRRKDGSAFPVEIAASPFQLDGEWLTSCAIRDLSGSWDAELRMRRLAAAVEQAGDAICILGADRRIEYVNPQYERQTGFPAEQVVGATPSRSAGDDSVFADIWDTVGRGRAWSGPLLTRRRDGRVMNEELSLTPVLDNAGVVSGYVAVMRDVTRRLEADLERRRLGQALRHCQDSIEILDSQGQIVYVNAAFEAATGQSLAEIRGSRPEALLDFSASGEAYDEMRRAARSGRPWSGTLKSVNLRGELREDEMTMSPMRDERGQVSGYVVVKRDITERRRAEGHAQQQQRLQSIGQLTDGIAHQLSGPIHSLVEHLDALAESICSLDRLLEVLEELAARPAPVAPATLAGCLQSADAAYLRREIGDILAHSTTAAGEVEGIVQAMHEISHTSSERTAVDLNRAIRSVVTVTASEWKPVAEVRTELDPELPAVSCMAAEIGQVLLSLLVNATQAIAGADGTGIRGKGVITIATRPVQGGVEIRVSDTGGVDREARERIFDRRAPKDGSRLGLALAHEIVTARHGGTMTLEDAAGRGVTFTLVLPLAPPERASATAAA